MSEEKDPLERTQELFEFLQGRIPEDYQIADQNVPKLTPDQAWTAIWYLGNQYWKVPDFIERCDVCGDLYNSHREGDCLDFGESPHFFCDACCCGEAFAAKERMQRRIEKNRKKKARDK